MCVAISIPLICIVYFTIAANDSDASGTGSTPVVIVDYSNVRAINADTMTISTTDSITDSTADSTTDFTPGI